MKKVLSLVLVLAMVLGSFSFAFAGTDDLTGHENEAAIRRLISLGLVKGDGTSYRPDSTITRAEFAAMAVRVLGKEKVAEISKGTTKFADVPANHWASGYIKLASTLEIIKGYGDGNFGPADEITYEQALAIIVRTLGYESAAAEKGGYPIGYLVVADDLGLTAKAEGVAGMPASRALVFQALDNALTIDMMVQVGFGDKATWEVKEGKTLLGELGYDKVTERVVGYDDGEITLEKSGAIEVEEGFDYEAVLGLKIAAWLDEDELVIFEVKDAPKFDATAGGDKIKLVDENKKYEVADKATLVLNGKDTKAADFTADYAKVVLNADSEIVWAQGFTWDDFMLAEKVKDDVVYSYGDELDIEDYTIVEDGKAAEVEEGDVLFFNDDEGYAVVYNNSETGKIDRIYTDSFKFAGTVYDYKLDNYDAKYFDGSALGVVSQDVLKAMLDEGDVEVFFDYAGNAVLVMGDTGEEEVDYFYGVVTATSTDYTKTDPTGRKKPEKYYTFDILNQDGKVVQYDLSLDFVDKNDGKDDKNVDAWAKVVKNAGVKVTVNADGDVKKVEVLEAKPDKAFKLDAKYVDGYKLQDSAVVFLVTGAYKDAETFAWADAADHFSEVETASVYVGDNGRIVAMLVTAVPEGDTTPYVGLITNVRVLRSGIEEVTIEIAGEEHVYLTEDDSLELIDDKLENKIVKIELTADDEIRTAVPYTNVATGLEVDTVSTANGTITVTGNVYKDIELAENAVIYNSKDFSTLKLRDIDEKDTIDVYFIDDQTERFVNYVVATLAPAVNEGGEKVVGKVVESINATSITVEGVQYPTTIDYTATIIKGDKITFELVEGLYGQKTMINVQKVTEE